MPASVNRENVMLPAAFAEDAPALSASTIAIQVRETARLRIRALLLAGSSSAPPLPRDTRNETRPCHTSSVKSIHQFWDALSAFGSHLSSVSVKALLLALGFHLANLLLRSNAWRNILLAAHPQPRVRRRTVTGAYLAGVGVNAVIPARGGDVMKVYLVHRGMADAPYATIASTLLAETVFDMVVGSVLLAWAFSRGLIPGTPELTGRLGAFEWSFFAGHGRLLAVVLAVFLIGLAFAMTWIERSVNRFWERVKDGLAMLQTPGRYLRQVASLQALGWGGRIVAMHCFLRAFHIQADRPD